MSTKLKTVDVRGKQFEVEVTERGDFMATFDGAQVKSETLVGLIEKLEKATKGATIKVAVPLYRLGKNGIERGVATGIHAANGNVLIKWDAGDSEQASSFQGYLDIPEAELEKAKELGEAIIKARNEWQNFERDKYFKPKEAVLKAINSQTT